MWGEECYPKKPSHMMIPAFLVVVEYLGSNELFASCTYEFCFT